MINKPTEVEVHYLDVQANVRHWKDATINGVDDENGELTPFKKGDCWCPRIYVGTGQIIGWPQGTKAEIHFKVCDEGVYTLLDESGEPIGKKDGYVPAIMCPQGSGFGDYIIMHIGPDGIIKNWQPTLKNMMEIIDNE